MKKFKVFLSAFAMIAALSFVGCSNDSKDPDPAPAPAAWDGIVDLTALPEYDDALGGIAKSFNPAASNYDEAFSYKISDLGYTDGCGYTKLYILGEVYNVDKYDLASRWDARIMLTIGSTSEYNAGVIDDEQYGGKHAIAFSSGDDVLKINIKDQPVTAVVITDIIFE